MIQVELQESMGNDISIANAAWTSTYDKDKREAKYDDKDKVKELVQRLADEGHPTPFEAVVFRFWIRMPIFVDRQHMTHRIASHNGLSGRYRTMPSDWFEVPDDVKIIMSRLPWMAGSLKDLMKDCSDFYRESLIHVKELEKAGAITNADYRRAREILRMVLGTGFMTERTTIMNLRSFANYQKLRNTEHAQPEIRTVAEKMLEVVEDAMVCPIAIEALKRNGWRI